MNVSSRHRLTPIPWEELQYLEQRQSLIKGVLDEGAMSVIYGDSNTGKTFAALDIAVHIASGQNWCNKKTKFGKTVYIAAEAGLSIANRLAVFRCPPLRDDFPPLYVIPSEIDLCDNQQDANILIEEINKIGDVAFIVIDTLARSMASGDENTPVDMGKFINNCDKIRRGTNAHVMIVHHSGKNADRGARGHSSLRAAIDTEIEITKKNDIITLRITKQRDGATGAEFHFQLKVIEIGKDEDGDDVTSCSLLPINFDKENKASRKLTKQNQFALDVLQDCIEEHGESRTLIKDQPPILCVTKEQYRQALQSANIAKSDKPDSIYKAIKRATEALQKQELAVIYREYIGLLDNLDKPEKA